MKKIIIKIGIVFTTLLPVFSFAAEKQTLKSLITLATTYFDYAITFLISLAILMFVYNIFKYFIAGGDDVAQKKEAGLYVMYSVIGFFVILSLWGLVYILTNTFNLTNTQPTFPFGSYKSSNNTSNSVLPPANSSVGPSSGNSSSYIPQATPSDQQIPMVR